MATQESVDKLAKLVTDLSASVKKSLDENSKLQLELHHTRSELEQAKANTQQELDTRDRRLSALHGRVDTAFTEMAALNKEASALRTAGDAALLQANRAYDRANLAGAGGAISKEEKLCPKDVLCNPTEWDVDCFRTEAQREYWERTVTAFFRKIIPDTRDTKRDFHEVERHLASIFDDVKIWVSNEQLAARLRGQDCEAEGQAAADNARDALANKFSQLLLLYVKNMPEGGPEAMRHLEATRKVKPFGEAERSEVEGVVKRYDQATLYRNIARATKPPPKKDGGRRPRGGKQGGQDSE